MESKIQIEFITNTKGNKIIQTIPFEVGLKITNIDNKPFPGATISSIWIKSASGQNIGEKIDKEFSVPSINPNQSVVVNLGKTGTYMFGLAQIQINLLSAEKDKAIATYQRNQFTGEIQRYQINSWIDFFYIRSIDEYTRDNTNNVLGRITIVMAVMTVAQVYLAWGQFQYAKIESIPAQINQARAKEKVREFCKENPTSQYTGQFSIESGKELNCVEFMKIK